MRDWKVYEVTFGNNDNHNVHSVKVLARTVKEASEKAERFSKSRPAGSANQFDVGDYVEDCRFVVTIDTIS